MAPLLCRQMHVSVRNVVLSEGISCDCKWADSLPVLLLTECNPADLIMEQQVAPSLHLSSAGLTKERKFSSAR